MATPEVQFKSNGLETYEPVSNGAAELISYEEPYVVSINFTGSAAMLFHGWNCEAVNEKAIAKKGSKAKKTDNLESYVYRNEEGEICIPGVYFRQAAVMAAKFRQDPRSPRKSAMDLFKAGLISLNEFCPINGGVKDWDYIDQRRVVIQQAAITRHRPAFKVGWQASCDFQIALPEYIQPSFLLDVFSAAGRLIGVGDHRPTYGRFQITKYGFQSE